MDNVYINDELLLRIEIALILFNAAALCVTVVFRHFPIKIAMLISCMILIVCGGFRLETYNSDTRNYFSYFSGLSLERGWWIYTLTKIEPLHIFLLQISPFFRIWLWLEAALSAFLLYKIYRRTTSVEIFILIVSLFETLYTSSMRFAVAILVLSYFLTFDYNKYIRAAVISVVAGASHVIMIAAGPFSTRNKYVPVIFSVIFYAAALYIGSVRERSGIYSDDVKSIGLKSFAVFVIFATYVSFARFRKMKLDYIFDIVGMSVVFVMTAMWFPFVNRTIVIALLCLSFDLNYSNYSFYRENYLSRVALLLVYLFMTVPYIYFVRDLFYSNLW